MTKKHVQHNGVWIYEVTLDPSPTLPRAVPEAEVIRCYSPDAMAQWLAVVGAPWTGVRTTL